jgi:hypothetical protein
MIFRGGGGAATATRRTTRRRRGAIANSLGGIEEKKGRKQVDLR